MWIVLLILGLLSAAFLMLGFATVVITYASIFSKQPVAKNWKEFWMANLVGIVLMAIGYGISRVYLLLGGTGPS